MEGALESSDGEYQRIPWNQRSEILEIRVFP